MNCSYFYEVEKKYNLFDREYKGFQFWAYIRRRIEWEMEKQVDNKREAHYAKERTQFEKILLLWNHMKYIIKNGRIPHKEYDILFVAHPRRVYNGEKYECIYTDIIADQFDNSITIEKSYQEIHYEPVQTKKIIYTDIIEFYIKFLCVYKSFVCTNEINKLKNYFEKQIAEAVEDLNCHYGTSISPKNISEEMVYMYYTHRVMFQYFTKVLRRTKPRVIIEVVSYSMECQVINEIAYHLGIPTIELQHGTITKDHIAYNYPESVTIKQFPQNIMLFSEFWKEGIKYPISQEHVWAVGYPHIEKQKQKYKDNKKMLEPKTRVLFLSSGPIGDVLADTAVKLNNLLPKDSFEIIYKLHPGEYCGWRERYPNLAKTKIRVISDNKIDLHQLFCECDIQVSGFSSTTIFEGVYFGLETYVSDYCLIDEIRNLEKRNLLTVFNTAEELSEMIMSRQTINNQEKPCLWKTDALNNVLRELKEIMEKRA